MLRPRESRDLRLISSNVVVKPSAVVTWAHDVFGNAVATATFQTTTACIVFDSLAELELDAVASSFRDRCLGYFLPLPLFG
jgi:hypothetical protein